MRFIEHTVEELALDIKTGKTPPTTNQQYFGGDINWLSPSDLKGQKVISESARTITQLAIEDKEAFLLKPGSVIISTIGDIGKTCIADKPLSTNQQLTSISLDTSVILPDLFYFWVFRSNNSPLNYDINH